MNADSNQDSKTRVIVPGLCPGKALKHFELDRVLGEGGMGLVYRAFDSKLHRPVAIKFLSSELTADPERKQRFLLEARAAARINHPAVAQIYDVDEQDGTTFIVMELVEGKTLRDLVRNKELDLLGSIDIAIQIAEGLGKAHKLGILHRDIKPANIMLTADGHVKILDFGLAKLLYGGQAGESDITSTIQAASSVRTHAGTILGTPAYMSPEQIRGLSVDARSDLFSLGVLIYEMVSGQSPFQRESLMDSLHAVTFDETPPMQSQRVHIPGDLQRIVTKCLRKQPEDRYTDAHSLVQELRRVRRDTEAGIVQKTTWRQRVFDTWDNLRHQPRSRFAWFAFGAAGLVAGLYLSFSQIGTGGVVFLTVAALLIYRHVRNRPNRMQERFVRKVAKIPEVRLIMQQDHQFTVVVDEPVAQLYSRINTNLRNCNSKLYFGTPMTVCIVHEASSSEINEYLSKSGVHYVREDVLMDRGRKRSST